MTNETEKVTWDIDKRVLEEIDRIRTQFHPTISRELVVQLILVGNMTRIDITD